MYAHTILLFSFDVNNFATDFFSIFIFVRGEQIMYEIFSKLLQARGITPYKVSKETGVSQSTLSDWKRGVSTPKQDKLQKIADYFGVSLEYLMTGKENEDNKYYLNNETAEVAQEIFENKELRALFDVQKDMPPEDLRALHSMALALKRKERGDIDDTGC